MSEEHEELHRELEHEADDLERARDDLDRKLASTRDDWESRRASQSVPGAEGTPGGLEGAAEREREGEHEDDDAPEEGA